MRRFWPAIFCLLVLVIALSSNRLHANSGPSRAHQRANLERRLGGDRTRL